MSMTFRAFSEANARRCTAPGGFAHPVDLWSLSDWMTATVGEVGEAANIIKKLNRHRDGIANRKGETPEMLQAALGSELADAFCYLDLMCQAAGVDLEAAVIAKFDAISAEIGYPERLA